MNVGELRKALEVFDPDMEVTIDGIMLYRLDSIVDVSVTEAVKYDDEYRLKLSKDTQPSVKVVVLEVKR